MIKEIELSILKKEFDPSNIDFLIDEFTDFLLSAGASSISNIPPYSKRQNLPESSLTLNVDLNFTLQLPDTFDENKFMLLVLSNYDVKFNSGFRKIPNIDWVLFSQSSFKPICIYNKLWIGASWHQTPPKEPDEELLKIFIDPGLAFGTGTHPTTKLCLESLITLPIKNKNLRVLDLGCGSGILSIAAYKLGFGSVTAVDNDITSLNVAKQNTIKNNMKKNDCTFCKDLKDTVGKFDLIISNILFTTLAELSSLIIKKLNKDGSLILSGVLESQFFELKYIFLDASKNKVSLEKIRTENEWVCLAHFGL